ncbi:MAG: GyrI-like domain-containing protein [Spirochaetes bacterium]|nr:GyrI-like domain-containing protein [Spirochaetota bacterium]
MADRSEFLRQEYVSRINRVIDHIDAHLGDEFSLAELADVACFSRFHFHRIFSALVGETIADYIKRVRLQAAASRLVNNPRDSVTEIALACGFSSPSVFARAFRERFGVSASAWRARSARSGAERNEGIAESNAGQADRKHGDAREGGLLHPREHLRDDRRNIMAVQAQSIEVKELPELHAAYIRHIGPYNRIGEAFGKLMRWAGPRGLLRFPETMSLAVYRDSPEVTDASKLRSDACITVPDGTTVDGEVGLMKIPGGRFVVGRFEISGDQFAEAWNVLMGGWLPGSGYQPDDRMCYEVYLNDHEQHPQKKFIIDICEPVKPL